MLPRCQTEFHPVTYGGQSQSLRLPPAARPPPSCCPLARPPLLKMTTLLHWLKWPSRPRRLLDPAAKLCFLPVPKYCLIQKKAKMKTKMTMMIIVTIISDTWDWEPCILRRADLVLKAREPASKFCYSFFYIMPTPLIPRVETFLIYFFFTFFLHAFLFQIGL